MSIEDPSGEHCQYIMDVLPYYIHEANGFLKLNQIIFNKYANMASLI